MVVRLYLCDVPSLFFFFLSECFLIQCTLIKKRFSSLFSLHRGAREEVDQREKLSLTHSGSFLTGKCKEDVLPSCTELSLTVVYLIPELIESFLPVKVKV